MVKVSSFSVANLGDVHGGGGDGGGLPQEEVHFQGLHGGGEYGLTKYREINVMVNKQTMTNSVSSLTFTNNQVYICCQHFHIVMARRK